MDVFFKSPEHKQRLAQVIQRIGKVERDGKLDPEYASALYILTSDASTWQVVSKYVDRDGIEFEVMLKKVYFTSTEATPIKLAGNLLNGKTKVDPVELARVDESDFVIALTALQIRRYGLQLSDIV